MPPDVAGSSDTVFMTLESIGAGIVPIFQERKLRHRGNDWSTNATGNRLNRVSWWSGRIPTPKPMLFVMVLPYLLFLCCHLCHPTVAFLSSLEGYKLLGPSLSAEWIVVPISIIKVCEDTKLELAFGPISSQFFFSSSANSNRTYCLGHLRLQRLNSKHSPPSPSLVAPPHPAV